MTANPPATQPAAANPGFGLGIAGLILAIIWPLQLLGLILSIVARGQSKRAGFTNGPATAGIIISIVIMVLSVIIAIAFGGLIWGLIQTCGELGSGVHEVNGVTYSCG
jgi:hypothetical protein